MRKRQNHHIFWESFERFGSFEWIEVLNWPPDREWTMMKIDIKDFATNLLWCTQKSQDQKTCFVSLAQTQLCNSFTWKWSRCEICPRTSLTLQHQDDSDLHPCYQSFLTPYPFTIITYEKNSCVTLRMSWLSRLSILTEKIRLWRDCGVYG